MYMRTLISIEAYENFAQPSFLIPHMLFTAHWISSAGGKKVKSCAAVETSSVRTLTCILALFFLLIATARCTNLSPPILNSNKKPNLIAENFNAL